MDYLLIDHTIIDNAPDQLIFNTSYRKNKSDKIRLVCNFWSINKNKGFEYYKFLDSNLDFKKYSFTYIGNDPGIKFKNIKQIRPFDSENLARHLSNHDILVTVSQYECCSNSLLEAMACGLPAVGLNSGGTPEVIGKGGLLFDSKDTTNKCPRKISANLSFYGFCLYVHSIKDCTGLIEPDTLMRDNNRQTLRCHYGAETNIQAIHQRV